MSRSGLLAIFCAVVPGISLARCGGGGADVQTETHTTTIGQEFLDLQRAKDAGLLSDAEYNRQRSLILNRKN